MVLLHFLAHKLFCNLPFIHAFAQQTEEKILLIFIGVFFVVTQQAILAKQFSSRPHDPGYRWEKSKAFGGSPVCG